MSRRPTIDAPDTAKPGQLSEEEQRFRELRGALANLAHEVRTAAGIKNTLGLRVNVALNVAERALRRYPAPDGDG